MNSSICGCGSKGNSFLNDPLIKDSNFNLVFQPIEFEIVLVDIAIVKKSPDKIDSAILLLRWQRFTKCIFAKYLVHGSVSLQRGQFQLMHTDLYFHLSRHEKKLGCGFISVLSNLHETRAECICLDYQKTNVSLVLGPKEVKIVLVDVAIVEKSPDQMDSTMLLLKMAAVRQGTTFAKAKILVNQVCHLLAFG